MLFNVIPNKIYFAVLLIILTCNEVRSGDLTIDILDLDICDVDGDAIDVDLNLYDDDNGELTGDVYGELTYEVNKDFSMEIYIEQWKDEKYVKKSKSVVPICDVFNAITDVWANIREQFNPPIEEECLIKPAEYSLEGLTLTREDVQDLLGDFKGVHKFTLRLKDASKTDVSCVYVELDVKEE